MAGITGNRCVDGVGDGAEKPQSAKLATGAHSSGRRQPAGAGSLRQSEASVMLILRLVTLDTTDKGLASAHKSFF
jgi:hypothetical protein